MDESVFRKRHGLVPLDGLVTLVAVLVASMLFSAFETMQRQVLLYEVACVLLPAVLVLVASGTFLRVFTPPLPVKKMVPATLYLMVSASALGFGTGALIDNICDIGEVSEMLEKQVLSYGIPAQVVLFCVVPAVCEEVLFRGVILNSLLKLGRTAAVVITSVVFAAFHGSIELFAPILVVSFALSVIGLQKGGLAAAITCHFLHNLLNVAMINLPGLSVTLPASITLTAVSLLCLVPASLWFFKREKTP